jgi:type IV secretion system protein VirB9
MSRLASCLAAVLALSAWCWPCLGQVRDAPEGGDLRIRSVDYSAELVYSLRGYVGYQIDLEFEPGETFQGLGAGDVQGIAFAAQGNHLFIKPRTSGVHTNITVLTSRRAYRLEYTIAPGGAEAAPGEILYALRFRYPTPPAAAGSDSAAEVERKLEADTGGAPANRDYWFCGPEALKPVAAEDDGVHTRLRFDSRGEMPALFVLGEDGAESLLNFNIEHGDVVVHRVAPQFVVRRGKLVGCIVNKGYMEGRRPAASGTVAPTVERRTLGGGP